MRDPNDPRFAGTINRAIRSGRTRPRRQPVNHHERWIGKLFHYRRAHSGGVFTAAEITDMIRTMETAGIQLAPYIESTSANLVAMAVLE